jgi:hypothetical protein
LGRWVAQVFGHPNGNGERPKKEGYVIRSIEGQRAPFPPGVTKQIVKASLEQLYEPGQEKLLREEAPKLGAIIIQSLKKNASDSAARRDEASQPE